MTAATDSAARGFQRDRFTWYAYLLLSYYAYVTSLQGNIIPYLKAELHLTYAEVGLHPSAIAVGFIFVGLFGEPILARFGRATIFVAAAYGSAAGLLLLSLAPAAWASIGACLIIGCFGAFIPATVSAVLSDVYGRYRDIAYAEANALCYAFSIMAPLLTALAAALHWNWRLGLLAGALVAVFIVRRYRGTPVPGSLPAAEVSRGEARLPPAYWAFWTVLALSVALEYCAILWAPAYFEQVGGFSASAAAAGAGLFFVGMLVGRFVGITLIRLYPARPLFLASCALTLVGFAAYWLVSAPLLGLLGLLVIGLGIANMYPLAIGFCMAAAGGTSARASGRAIIAPGVAILLNPPLLGTIADDFGLHAAQLVIPAFLVVTLAALALAITFQRRVRAVGP